MLLQQIARRELVFESIAAGDAEAAICELLARAAARLGWDRLQMGTWAEAILRRERQSPSGLAHGLAFPSVRLPELASPVLVIGLSRHGVNFHAPDGWRANVVILYLGRQNPPSDEREMLKRLSGALATDEIAAHLLKLESADGVWNAILSIDALYPDKAPAPTREVRQAESS